MKGNDRMYKYTICFIRKGNNILLLNRNKKPTMGMWNGVGGKIEDNETPYEGIIREAFEETGIELQNVTYKGNIINYTTVLLTEDDMKKRYKKQLVSQ